MGQPLRILVWTTTDALAELLARSPPGRCWIAVFVCPHTSTHSLPRIKSLIAEEPALARRRPARILTLLDATQTGIPGSADDIIVDDLYLYLDGALRRAIPNDRAFTCTWLSSIYGTPLFCESVFGAGILAKPEDTTGEVLFGVGAAVIARETPRRELETFAASLTLAAHRTILINCILEDPIDSRETARPIRTPPEWAPEVDVYFSQPQQVEPWLTLSVRVTSTPRGLAIADQASNDMLEELRDRLRTPAKNVMWVLRGDLLLMTKV
jgi:hypothetical protein